MEGSYNPYSSRHSLSSSTAAAAHHHHQQQQQQGSPLQHPLIEPPTAQGNATSASLLSTGGRPPGGGGGDMGDILGVMGYDGSSNDEANRGEGQQSGGDGNMYGMLGSSNTSAGGGGNNTESADQQQMVLQQLLLLEQLQNQQEQSGMDASNLVGLLGNADDGGGGGGHHHSCNPSGHDGLTGNNNNNTRTGINSGMSSSSFDNSGGNNNTSTNEDEMQLSLLLQQQREAAAAAAAGGGGASSSSGGGGGGYGCDGINRGGGSTTNQNNHSIQQLQQQLTFAMALQLLQQQGGSGGSGGSSSPSTLQQQQQLLSSYGGSGGISPSLLAALSQQMQQQPSGVMAESGGGMKHGGEENNSALAAAAAMMMQQQSGGGGDMSGMSGARQRQQQQQEASQQDLFGRSGGGGGGVGGSSSGYSAMSTHQQQILHQHVVDHFDMTSDRWTQATGKQLELIIRALYQCNPHMREKGDLAAAIWHSVGMLCLHRATAVAAAAGSTPTSGTSPSAGGARKNKNASMVSSAAELRTLLMTSKEWQVAAAAVFSIAHIINSLYSDKCGRVDQKSLLMALTLAASPNSLTESELLGISRLQQSILVNVPVKALTDEVAPSLIDPYIRNLKPLIDLLYPTLLDETRLPVFERSALRYALQGYNSRLCLFADSHLLALTSIALASTEFGINVTQLSHPYRPNVPWYQLVGGESAAAKRSRKNGTCIESDLHVAVQLLLKYCRSTAAAAARRAAAAKVINDGTKGTSPMRGVLPGVGGGALPRRLEFDTNQKLGVSILGDEVVEVDPGQQALCMGVRPGWKIVKVNDHAFSGEVLRHVIGQRGRCIITFEVPADDAAVTAAAAAAAAGLNGFGTDSGSTTVTGGSDWMNIGNPGAPIPVPTKRGASSQQQQGSKQGGGAASPNKRRKVAAKPKAKATATGRSRKNSAPVIDKPLIEAATDSVEVAAAAMAAVGLANTVAVEVKKPEKECSAGLPPKVGDVAEKMIDPFVTSAASAATSPPTSPPSSAAVSGGVLQELPPSAEISPASEETMPAGPITHMPALEGYALEESRETAAKAGAASDMLADAAAELAHLAPVVGGGIDDITPVTSVEEEEKATAGGDGDGGGPSTDGQCIEKAPEGDQEDRGAGRDDDPICAPDDAAAAVVERYDSATTV
ncbi:hypothetical protein FOL47_006907 [Perkinsus chesapeaki]|uniref:PDZ domain-containing protein n=1 Tax=Perkinsus chesapeaki TaxID=330153 RepID=A0A7J6LNZ8_PERCH|nr:hypothetical protein FOL47_006907 [Perkinsus chesapeaki]